MGYLLDVLGGGDSLRRAATAAFVRADRLAASTARRHPGFFAVGATSPSAADTAAAPLGDDPSSGHRDRNNGALVRVAWATSSVGLAFVVLQQSKRLGLLKPLLASKVVNGLVVSVGGLLSSSCCALQLALNYFSLSCAGFAALDIFRPFFRALTFGAMVARSLLEHRDGIFYPRPGSWAAAAFLSFLPELVRFRNRLDLSSPGAGKEESGGAAAAGQVETVTLRANVAGVKCEACANGLRNSFVATDSVAGARVVRSAVVFGSKESSLVEVTVEVASAYQAEATVPEAAPALPGAETALGEGPAAAGVAGLAGAVDERERGRALAWAVVDAACSARDYTYTEVEPPSKVPWSSY
mmetsp:Transcript_48841/g.110840  ORF Transcript_48841/g.110840 Transcript_48841/m.110840 type:complete len:355 (+) Transcript_48841:108-1172(+)